MKTISEFFKLLKVLGYVNTQAATVEQELSDCGFEIERCRINRTSIHDVPGLADKIKKAEFWAQTARFGQRMIVDGFDQGAALYRASHR